MRALPVQLNRLFLPLRFTLANIAIIVLGIENNIKHVNLIHKISEEYVA